LSASGKSPVTAFQKDTSYTMALSNIRSKEYESSILLYTEACAPSVHSNQPKADKSPAQKPAGKSHPDQPSKMKTATYQWPFLFHGDAKMDKVEKKVMIFFFVINKLKLTSFVKNQT